MSAGKEEIPLVPFICNLTLSKFIKKPLIGGPYLILMDIFEVFTQLYSIGAALGHARHSQLDILVKLITTPMEEHKGSHLKSSLEEAAKKRLEAFRKNFGREPDGFKEFIFYQALGVALRSKGIELSPEDAATAYYIYGDRKLKKLFDEKVDLQMAEPEILLRLMEGIFFGALFPELTEKMYQKAKDDAIASLKPLEGLKMPKEWTVITDLKKTQDTILQAVALYTQEYHPELLEKLDLRKYLK